MTRPGYKLFSPGTIGLVAFLAGPAGAFILLTLNYRRLGKRKAAWATIAVGLLTMAALTASLMALPESFPGFLIGLPLFLILWIAAKTLQGNVYDAHLRQGGEPASGWAAAGFAVLGIVLYLGMFFGIFLTYELYVDGGLGPKIDYGNGEEVYYTKGATEADARALGTLLRQAGYFDGKGPKSVRVARDGNRVVISLVVSKRALTNLQVQQEFRAIGQQASQKVFGGRQVTVELCDEYFAVKMKL
jgi:hypothetical protein